jgi:class I fructose-bisphosphate aldolase
MKLAKKGKVTGVVFQKGVAEKYYDKKSKVPLIVKLNGKTNLLKGDPVSRQLCTVKEAVKLGAKGVGYTIYVGSKHENTMFREFEKIQREAHARKIPVIVWMYPRGKAIKNEFSRKTLAYAARVGLELGADMIKIKYNGKIKDLRWIVKCAGKCKIVIAGGKKSKNFFSEARDVMKTDVVGLAVGRNIWQADHPIWVMGKLRKIIWKK